jgi:hypothetical protein
MMAVIQEDENCNTSRRRVLESSASVFHQILFFFQFNLWKHDVKRANWTAYLVQEKRKHTRRTVVN